MCAISCASTNRRRSSDQSAAVRGSRIVWLKIPVVSGPGFAAIRKSTGPEIENFLRISVINSLHESSSASCDAAFNPFSSHNAPAPGSRTMQVPAAHRNNSHRVQSHGAEPAVMRLPGHAAEAAWISIDSGAAGGPADGIGAGRTAKFTSGTIVEITGNANAPRSAAAQMACRIDADARASAGDNNPAHISNIVALMHTWIAKLTSSLL